MNETKDIVIKTGKEFQKKNKLKNKKLLLLASAIQYTITTDYMNYYSHIICNITMILIIKPNFAYICSILSCIC